MHFEMAAPLLAWDRLFGWKRRHEARATLLHAGSFLRPGSSALDIGCGMGYAIEVLEDDFDVMTFGCDVVPSTTRLDRFVRFDGWRLPFADGSVDVALLIFVLHHAEDPRVLLREASRVARRAVLVVEDTPRTAFDRAWGRLHIRSFNKRHKIPWTGRLRSEWEWRRLFSSMGMALRDTGYLTRWERLPPVARSAFVLQPAAAEQRAAQPVRRARGATT